MATQPMWHWEAVDPGRNIISGDVAKLFKNEPVKNPGVLGVDAPSADATILAREAIQNSWDAGRQLRLDLKVAPDDVPPFRVRFVYQEFTDEDKTAACPSDSNGTGSVLPRRAMTALHLCRPG